MVCGTECAFAPDNLWLLPPRLRWFQNMGTVTERRFLHTGTATTRRLPPAIAT